ncbi:MAG: hypothetical protein RLZZ84_1631 [Pseudomonadota bacterium]|jgi:hypothetical protein
MPFDFNEYIASFNTLDEAAFAEKFYTEDLKVAGEQGVIPGRDQWVAVLNMLHVGIKEELVPIDIVREGDTIMAHMDGTFTATQDRPDFPYGALKTGESVTVRMFSLYRVRGDRISEMAIASWNPAAQIVHG